MALVARMLFCILVTIAGGATHAHGACRIEPRAEVPVWFAQSHPLVELTVNGRPATFLLDTGAERTVFADTAVRELGLARDPWVSSSVRGVGGVIEMTANAVPRSFAIGGLALRRRGVNPALSFVVAPLPWHELGGRTISGLLGADYLSAFDLDLDPPGGKLTLYETVGCAHQAIPWAPANTSVPLTRPRPYTILAPVEIDGRTLMAQLDTGASVSLVSRKGAARLGIAPEMTAPAPGARGVGPQALPLRSRVFAAARLGPVEYRDVTLMFGAPAGGFAFDMLLGMDLLRGQRIFISYATNRLLIATRQGSAALP
jgi:predicted aspartyl protease